MLRKILFLALAFGLNSLFAHADHSTLFKLRIENVSSESILMSRDGGAAPAGLSPGVLILYKGSSNPLFVPGKIVSANGLESLAEDGNPKPLAAEVRKGKGVSLVQVFNMPAGAEEAGPIGPGGRYELSFAARPGDRLMLAQMFGQSNDLFYAPNPKGIELFDRNGTAISGDITELLMLWDAGTELNQEPGFGADQAPRQKAPNTGMEEHAEIGPVKDQFTYPAVSQVLKVTLTHE